MEDYEINIPSPEQIAFGSKTMHDSLSEVDPSFETHHTALSELAESIDKREVPEEVRKILNNAELIAVVVKEKPLSTIVLENLVDESELSGASLAENERFLKNIQTLRDILNEQNVKYVFVDSNADMWNPDSVNPPRGAEVWRQDGLVEAARFSGFFNEQEIASMENTPEDFLVNRMRANNQGYANVYRVGALYGYPLCDVRDNIEIQRITEEYKLPPNLDLTTLEGSNNDSDLGQKINRMNQHDRETLIQLKKSMYSVHIDGVEGSVGWYTYNRDDEEVLDKVKSLRGAFDLQRQLI
jgi:hypothetical protein